MFLIVFSPTNFQPTNFQHHKLSASQTFSPTNFQPLVHSTTLHPQGFSLHVCLALLLANTLRIIFWFGKHYETPLLIQSVLMNIAMFALIHLCVTINNKVSCSDGVSRNKINIELNVLFFPASAVSWWNWWDGGIDHKCPWLLDSGLGRSDVISRLGNTSGSSKKSKFATFEPSQNCYPLWVVSSSGLHIG